MKLITLESKYDNNMFSYVRCSNKDDQYYTNVAIIDQSVTELCEQLKEKFTEIVVQSNTLPGYRLYKLI